MVQFHAPSSDHCLQKNHSEIFWYHELSKSMSLDIYCDSELTNSYFVGEGLEAGLHGYIMAEIMQWFNIKNAASLNKYW